jgi:hypothetical protein
MRAPISARRPERGTGELLLARLPQVHGPLSPETRGALTPRPPLTPPSLVASLRSPIARPETIRRAAALDTAPAAAPARFWSTSAPAPPTRPAVARGQRRNPIAHGRRSGTSCGPRRGAEAELDRPARLSENPDRARLFPPRSGRQPVLGTARPRHPAPSRQRRPGLRLMAALGNGSGSGRDNAIIAEAMRGNVPDHIRALQPVRFTGTVGGRQTEIVICVTPDYLAVGSNSDHVRVPLGLPAALRVADAFDMMLPTTRMVDAIYAQADLRLSPRPMNPGPQMSSTDYFMRHDATLDGSCLRPADASGVLWRATRRTLCWPTGCPPTGAAWRSTAGTAAMATRSNRCRRSTANTTPITATESAWSAGRPMWTVARWICGRC